MSADDSGGRRKRAARDRKHPLKVYVTPEDRAEIQAQAASTRLTVPSYLRMMGLNCPIHSKVDMEAIGDLVRLNAEMTRRGALLKLWLSTPPDIGTSSSSVRQLLEEIKSVQQQIMTALASVRR